MDAQALPLISLAWDSDELVRKLHAACTGPGFFYLEDHGIAAQDIGRAFQVSRQFFQTTSDAERRQYPFDTSSGRGYTGIRQETLDTRLSRGDLKESFYLGPLKQMPQDLPQPFDTPENREFYAGLQEKLHAASLKVLGGLAMALGMKPEVFQTCHTAHENRMRLIHYPPVEGEADELDIRASAHSDYGSITLLICEGQPGLQVRTADGGWKDVEHRPGSLIVNIADALEFWTGGALKSTQHRVIMPSGQHAKEPRFSIAYFVQPDFDTTLEVLSGSDTMTDEVFAKRLRAKGIQPGSTRLTSGEFLKARLSASIA